MAIQMRLPKEDNVLYTDFEEAYWCIEGISFGSASGIAYTRFAFNAYPSKEAKLKAMAPIEPTLEHGGPKGMAYQPVLHAWEAVVPTLGIFPGGIPVSETEQKDVLYAYVKQALGLQAGQYDDIL